MLGSSEVQADVDAMKLELRDVADSLRHLLALVAPLGDPLGTDAELRGTAVADLQLPRELDVIAGPAAHDWRRRLPMRR